MNARRIITHDRALRDLADRSESIRQHNPRADLRFIDAEATFRRLAESPGMGTCHDPGHPAFGELRFFPISRFKNDLVFDRPLHGGIEVFRVLHGARDISGILAGEFGLGADADDDKAGEWTSPWSGRSRRPSTSSAWTGRIKLPGPSMDSGGVASNPPERKSPAIGNVAESFVTTGIYDDHFLI